MSQPLPQPPANPTSDPAQAQALPIEDYALIGDTTTAALVGRNGSIDWLCWPRFDSAACFAALLGSSHNGRWQIAPEGYGTLSSGTSQSGTSQSGGSGPATPHQPGTPGAATRASREGSLVLETLFTTATGSVAVIDFMPMGTANSAIVRLVEGRSGHVDMQMRIGLRFDYGTSVPWVPRLPEGHGISAIAGPEMVVLRSAARLHGEGMLTVAHFHVRAGQSLPFVLQHGASHLPIPEAIDPLATLAATDAHWREWSARCTYHGPYKDAVLRSLLTLKALTYSATGGIAAAATTSLPEQLGGGRNWDYRFCWLRDATLTLFAFMHAGYYDEARAWRDWLHRSIAGNVAQIQIMYGLAGERRLAEWEVPWLAGYQGASPVRVGNAASGQLQLDVYGEVMDALHQSREGGLRQPQSGWGLQCAILDHLESIWQLPDEGMWEVRGGSKHFTLSKVMVWVAFDRAVRTATRHRLAGPVERWRALRDQVHAEICENGVDPERGCFTQSYGSTDLDASLLLIPQVGFLPWDDPRVVATVAAVEHDLLVDDFVLRYRTESSVDGLPPGEGAFLACTFWLADAYALLGRLPEAKAMFERLLALRNDVGLLSEEYDPAAGRLVGNFPQAFSHVALVATALTLERDGPARDRGRGAHVAPDRPKQE